MTSTAIYTCYRQLHPPTGVDHAVFGSITAAGSHDLVVAKASILELYRVHRVGPGSDPAAAAAAGNNATAGNDATAAAATSSGGNDDNDDDASSFFLELAGTFPIAGTITSLAIIPVVGGDIPPPATANTNPSADTCADASASDTDADAKTTKAARRRQQQQQQSTQRQQQQEQDILVVSFGPAKMALVAYDSLLGRLGTLSIHNFDAEAIGPGAGGIESGYGLASALKDRPATISASDPSGRCLAAIVGGCQLVVLPTKKHVSPSVFVSEEAKQRAQQLRRRRSRRRGLLPPSSSEETAGDDVGFPAVERAEARGGGGGGGGASDYGSVGRNGVVGGDGRSGEGGAGGAPGGGEGDGSIGSDGPRDGGPRLAVLKPFTINLEEAGFTG